MQTVSNHFAHIFKLSAIMTFCKLDIKVEKCVTSQKSSTTIYSKLKSCILRPKFNLIKKKKFSSCFRSNHSQSNIKYIPVLPSCTTVSSIKGKILPTSVPEQPDKLKRNLSAWHFYSNLYPQTKISLLMAESRHFPFQNVGLLQHNSWF